MLSLPAYCMKNSNQAHQKGTTPCNQAHQKGTTPCKDVRWKIVFISRVYHFFSSFRTTPCKDARWKILLSSRPSCTFFLDVTDESCCGGPRPGPRAWTRIPLELPSPATGLQVPNIPNRKSSGGIWRTDLEASVLVSRLHGSFGQCRRLTGPAWTPGDPSAGTRKSP